MTTLHYDRVVRRPLPSIPRGPGRRFTKRPRRETFLFACPRVSPDWELAALSNLMKPKEHTKGAIRHRAAEQAWPAQGNAAVVASLAIVAERVSFDAHVEFADEGDYWFVAQIPAANVEEAKGLAVLLSQKLPDVWFVFDRLFVKAGTFYRRERGFKLNLVEATNVHLTRAVRAALR